jgi:CRP-like cAMP-binding protein
MTNKAALWFFESVNLFRILCPTKIKKLAESHVILTFKKDQIIHISQLPVQQIYLIVTGRVKIAREFENPGDAPVAILNHGEVFGELDGAGETTRVDFAQAMDNVTICPVTTDQLKGLMYDNKELSFKILKLIGLRIVKLERKVELLVFKDSRTRVVEFLRDTAVGKGIKVGEGTMIPTKLTHKDISSLTGTSRQRITAILNDLKENSLINFNRKQILIRDLDNFK